MDEFAVSTLNKVRRSDRSSYDCDAVFDLLKQGMVAHVGFIIDGRPIVIPMIYGCSGHVLYIHGAKAARFAKAMGPGVPVCITVTLTDAIVVGRSAFHCSMNYRSVVIHGHAKLVTEPAEAEQALAVVTDHMLPGRWAESRPVTDKEIRSTGVLRVEIEAASLKARSGQVIDEDDDYALPIWGGIIPVRKVFGTPEADPRVPAGIELPSSINALVSQD